VRGDRSLAFYLVGAGLLVLILAVGPDLAGHPALPWTLRIASPDGAGCIDHVDGLRVGPWSACKCTVARAKMRLSALHRGGAVVIALFALLLPASALWS
jgi:hypothetical protein